MSSISIVLLVGLLTSVLVWRNCDAAAASNFRWSASIDLPTGVAVSKEVSTIPPGCQLRKGKSPNKIFASYPSWLSKCRVTFGILKTRDVKGEKWIKDRLFGYDILGFGKPKVRNNCSVSIPIVGGLMALPSKDGAYGSLVFELHSDELETRVAYGYRPSIAGAAPVSRLRAWTYQSTQSLLHAYVMWRFHFYCYNAGAE